MANRSSSAAGAGYRHVPDFTGARVKDPHGLHLLDPKTGEPVSKGHGRPPGSKSQLSSEAKTFALEIVRSDEYRKSLMTRAANGSLPSNIEAMLWAYAYGRPTTHIAVTREEPGAGGLSGLSTADLAERAELIAKVLREVGDVEAADMALGLIDEAAAAQRTRDDASIDVKPETVE